MHAVLTEGRRGHPSPWIGVTDKCELWELGIKLRPRVRATGAHSHCYLSRQRVLHALGRHDVSESLLASEGNHFVRVVSRKYCTFCQDQDISTHSLLGRYVGYFQFGVKTAQKILENKPLRHTHTNTIHTIRFITLLALFGF